MVSHPMSYGFKSGFSQGNESGTITLTRGYGDISLSSAFVLVSLPSFVPPSLTLTL